MALINCARIQSPMCVPFVFGHTRAWKRPGRITEPQCCPSSGSSEESRAMDAWPNFPGFDQSKGIVPAGNDPAQPSRWGSVPDFSSPGSSTPSGGKCRAGDVLAQPQWGFHQCRTDPGIWGSCSGTRRKTQINKPSLYLMSVRFGDWIIYRTKFSGFGSFTPSVGLGHLEHLSQ